MQEENALMLTKRVLLMLKVNLSFIYIKLWGHTIRLLLICHPVIVLFSWAISPHSSSTCEVTRAIVFSTVKCFSSSFCISLLTISLDLEEYRLWNIVGESPSVITFLWDFVSHFDNLLKRRNRLKYIFKSCYIWQSPR